MAFFAANRVKVSTATTGLSDFVVGSATSAAFQSFASASVPDGATVHYTAFTATEFECGEGVYTSGTTTLSRATIFASSNSNNKVNFGSGPTIVIAPLAEEVHTAYADLIPATNNGFALGSTTRQWSDLFLAEGGVINWDNGDLTLTQTNNILDVAGGNLRAVSGVLFGADTAAENMLDDYEEGFWTPTMLFGGLSTGVTYSQQSASYTKIGDRVSISGRMQLTSNGTATGAATIGGLPFTAGPSGVFSETALCFWFDNLTGLSGGVFAYVEDNSTAITLSQGVTGNSTALTEGEVLDTFICRFGGVYCV